MMFKRKIHSLEKTPPNKLLGSLKRTLEINRKDPVHALETSFGTIASPQVTLTQPSRIELELNRNTAILYANTIPPR